MLYAPRLFSRAAPTKTFVRLPVHSGGGLMPGVDLTSNASLRDVMDEDTAVDALR